MWVSLAILFYHTYNRALFLPFFVQNSSYVWNYAAFSRTNLWNTLRKPRPCFTIHWIIRIRRGSTGGLLSSRSFSFGYIVTKAFRRDRFKNRDVNKMRRVGSSMLFLPALRAPQWRSRRNARRTMVSWWFSWPSPLSLTPRFRAPHETRYRRRLSSYYALKN